jgi:DNA mismatch repair ATPase MutS
MSDQFGFIEGAKSVTSSMDASRQASQSITKSITDVQKEAASAAQQKDLDRKRQLRESQVLKEQYFKRAMMEWQRQETIRIEEAKVKADFIKKHGAKRWNEVESIKQKIEKQDAELNREFKEDLAKSRRALFMCYALAAVIAYYLTWGHKG